jgi:transposase
MAKRRRRFTDEFKLEAVKMVIEQGRPVREVAESLGVSETGLHRWKTTYLERNGKSIPGQGALSPKDAEIRRLKKELAIARQERDILKKAAAYFANDKR